MIQLVRGSVLSVTTSPILESTCPFTIPFPARVQEGQTGKSGHSKDPGPSSSGHWGCHTGQISRGWICVRGPSEHGQECTGSAKTGGKQKNFPIGCAI